MFVENLIWQSCYIDKFFIADINFDTTVLFDYNVNKIKIFIFNQTTYREESRLT